MKNRTSTHHKIPILTFVLLATAVFLISCGGRAEGNNIAMQPELEPTAAALPTPTEETAVPTETAVEPEADECLLCHTDKDQLIKTADPVEEVISENEGEG
jgi:hypothetical protein